MALSVDLNADLGEGIGHDTALLPLLTSANVACGLHAGSPAMMAATMEAALKAGVGIGAHPGFDDRAHFGRRRMSLAATELRSLIAYQVGAAKAVAKGLGARLRHLKLHGALANMAAEDQGLAALCFQAATAVQPDLTILAIAATAQERAARALGLPVAAEVFADRGYNADATLIDRSLPGAVLHDAEEAAARVLKMLRHQALVTPDGTLVPTRIDSICLHGDTPEALEMAQRLRQVLSENGVRVAAF